MAKATFKKKNRNRYRKVYPYIRKSPVYEYCSDKAMEMEVGEILFSDSDNETYTFTSTFDSAPIINSISVDGYSNGSANVNVYVESVTTTTVTIRTSAQFTGKVHFHAIRISSTWPHVLKLKRLKYLFLAR